MGPGIGVRGRAASAAPKVAVVFACEAFSVTRESRDRYKLTDALSVSIRSAAELASQLRGRMAEAARMRIHYAQAHEELARMAESGDAPPAPELVRKVQAAGALRIVPQPVIETPVVTTPKVKRAPAKGTMKNRPKKKKEAAAVFAAPPANNNAALAGVPHKRDDSAPAPAPRRRTGGLSYLKLLASQEVIEEAPQQATAV